MRWVKRSFLKSATTRSDTDDVRYVMAKWTTPSKRNRRRSPPAIRLRRRPLCSRNAASRRFRTIKGKARPTAVPITIRTAVAKRCNRYGRTLGRSCFKNPRVSEAEGFFSSIRSSSGIA